MKIKQVIINDDTVYVFTDNPEEDIITFKEYYTNDDDVSILGFPTGYEEPELTDFNFLGNKYKCISLWFDNEDIPEQIKKYTNYIDEFELKLNKEGYKKMF